MNGTWIRRPRGSLTVVFIHGALSSGETCWAHANGTQWPGLLAREQQLSSIGIYVFEYKTGFFSGTYNLGDVVDALTNRLRLDAVLNSSQLVFVCHSMGGIVARRFLVQRALHLVEQGTEIGLFLLASPSLGSRYANWLSPLARFFNHTQADVLRFAQNNTWLNDLDRDFLNLKDSGRLRLRGKELVEDQFVVLPGFWSRQVVEPFSGAKYWGESYKVENSDHFSIAKVPNAEAIQHRLLVEFIRDFARAPSQEALAPADGVCRIRFADDLKGDLVDCHLAVEQIAENDCPVEIVWPEKTITYSKQVQELSAQITNYHEGSSLFYGVPPDAIADFAQKERKTTKRAEMITGAAAVRAKCLVKGMLPHWGLVLDNIIARSLSNFLTLCNFEIIISTIFLFRHPNWYELYFPKEYEGWFKSYTKDTLRQVFEIEEEVYSARIAELSGRPLRGVYFWGPRRDVLASADWQPGEPIRGTWFDKYIIPQNELRLLEGKSNEIFPYDEQVRIDKILDRGGQEVELK